jgi:hypothetical protein
MVGMKWRRRKPEPGEVQEKDGEQQSRAPSDELARVLAHRPDFEAILRAQQGKPPPPKLTGPFDDELKKSGPPKPKSTEVGELARVQQLEALWPVEEGIKAFDRYISEWLEFKRSRGMKIKHEVTESGRTLVAGEEAKIIDRDTWPHLHRVKEFFRIFGETVEWRYNTGGAPASSPADTPQKGMRDETHDLNTLAADLGYSFEEAAEMLTAGQKTARKVSPDPLSRARRVVRNFDNRVARNPDLVVPREVADARSFVNRSNYQNRKAKTAKP